MSVALQNLVVSVAALGAAIYFVRRLFAQPASHAASLGATSCAGCQMHARVLKSPAAAAKKPAPVR